MCGTLCGKTCGACVDYGFDSRWRCHLQALLFPKRAFFVPFYSFYADFRRFASCLRVAFCVAFCVAFSGYNRA